MVTPKAGNGEDTSGKKTGASSGAWLLGLGEGAVALAAESGDDDLLRAADTALYKAKRGGRNIVEIADS